MSWKDDQEWERDWWGGCFNTLSEEQKQIVYAEKLGIPMFHNGKTPYNLDVKDRTIVDIGGGPISLMLKAANLKAGTVVDPLDVPDWVIARYRLANIKFVNIPAEEYLHPGSVDEVWIYNCLQHTLLPETIIKTARRYCGVIRIFEWINTPPTPGHPHTLTKEMLDSWLGGEGKVERMTGRANLNGDCYYGVFDA